ncbi:MAG: flagellar export chaperone FliS [Acidobacteria bacterium]|nr:flagellar export chaperone FliS [Acidobacteriota bacterium]
MNHPYAAYLESDIISATPVQLVRMLYRAALDSIGEARRCLAAGKIRERSAAISRALEILVELSGSLDPAAGELSVRLAALYDYMQRRLIDANFHQADAPMAEAASLLETLAEAWNQISADGAEVIPNSAPDVQSESDFSSPWAAIPAAEPRDYAVSSWSL